MAYLCDIYLGYYALATGGGMHYYYLKPEFFDFNRGAMVISIDKLQLILNRIYQDIERNGFDYLT